MVKVFGIKLKKGNGEIFPFPFYSIYKRYSILTATKSGIIAIIEDSSVYFATTQAYTR